MTADMCLHFSVDPHLVVFKNRSKLLLVRTTNTKEKQKPNKQQQRKREREIESEQLKWQKSHRRDFAIAHFSPRIKCNGTFYSAELQSHAFYFVNRLVLLCALAVVFYSHFLFIAFWFYLLCSRFFAQSCSGNSNKSERVSLVLSIDTVKCM